MNDKILKITFLPDLAMPKYASRHGASAKQRAGSVIANIVELMDPHADEWILLRYLYNPIAASMQERLRLYLRIHASETTSGKIPFFVGQHLLSDFYIWNEVSLEDAIQGMNVKSGHLFLVKCAEEISFDPNNEFLYYAPLPLPKDLPSIVDKVNIDALLHSFASPCLIDITVRPSELLQEESNALLVQLKELDRLSSAFEPERREMGSIEDLSRQRDILASHFKDYYQDYFDSLYFGKICEFSIKVLCPNKREGMLMAYSIGEAFAPNGRTCVYERDLRSTDAGKALIACEHYVEEFKRSNMPKCYSERLLGLPERIEIPPKQLAQSILLSRLCCLSDMKNASRLLELPTSEGVYFRTIRIESEMRGTMLRDKGNGQTIQIGEEVERPGLLEIDTDQIKKHLFVAGVTGSGKTTSILNVLIQLWEKHHIPFLVFEPVKSEYRILLDNKSSIANDLRIYSPGNERLSPFRFNPLEVPPGITVEEHISAIESCFAGAIPMYSGPLPSLISEATVHCYETQGFKLYDIDTMNKTWPTMRSLLDSLHAIMENRGYVGEVKSNLTTAIDVRLKPLCQRSVGAIFSSNRSVPSVEELLRWPTIIEMDSLNIDQQNLLILFLLTSIREWVSRQGHSEKLKHVIVLEEAHNLIGVQSVTGRISEDFADPRGHAARFLVKMLAEIRAYGEGIMVVDQSPAAIAPEVLKGTSIKIVHRTVSEDDRDALAAAMLMDKYAHEELARLEVGQAFVYHERLYRPGWVRSINPMTESLRPENASLLNKLSKSKWFFQEREKRKDNLIESLENIIYRLNLGCGAKVRRIKKGESINDWEKFKTSLSLKVREEINALIRDAMLDQSAKKELREIHEDYAYRVDKSFETASSVFKEVTNGSKKD